MNDRLESPFKFLESMRTNFLGADDWQVKSRLLLDALTDAIQNHSTQEVQKWIENIDFDPESLGSAFFMVYRFAIDYVSKSTHSRL